MPPAAPEPTITASYVLLRSISGVVIYRLSTQDRRRWRQHRSLGSQRLIFISRNQISLLGQGDPAVGLGGLGSSHSAKRNHLLKSSHESGDFPELRDSANLDPFHDKDISFRVKTSAVRADKPPRHEFTAVLFT